VIDNWYFMATSVIVLTLVGGLITDKLVEPRLGQWQGSRDEKLQTLTPRSVSACASPAWQRWYSWRSSP
jgi:aminobenzoyl-glutamate transport protein